MKMLQDMAGVKVDWIDFYQIEVKQNGRWEMKVEKVLVDELVVYIYHHKR